MGDGPVEIDDLTRVMEAARAGDQDSWELLFRQVYPRLRAYLGRRLGSADVDDAVSETMARAVAGVDRFVLGPAGFDGWVFGIARRVAADHHRHSERLRHRPPPAAGAFEREPGEALLESEEHLRVRRAFERLSSPEREVLELRVVAGLSAEQVAAILGKRPGAIRTAQSRALAHLRRILENDGG